MSKNDMSPLDWVAFVLVAIGGLNWGLVGVGMFVGGSWDLVQLILGSIPVLRNIVYILVGLSAIYMVVMLLMKD